MMKNIFFMASLLLIVSAGGAFAQNKKAQPDLKGDGAAIGGSGLGHFTVKPGSRNPRD